jgi:GNAT superfamily N-acetyltransferase
MDCMGTVLRGSWGSGCWCMFPRLASAANQLGSRGRREAMTRLARRHRAPGLLAFDGGESIGWIAIAPRKELRRVDASRATPRVDHLDVWVIPCITVRPSARGRGVAKALIKAAIAYAKKHGAPAVEAYPRAGSARTKDDNAFFGTEPLFRAAGFKVIAGPTVARLPRVTMRKRCASA